MFWLQAHSSGPRAGDSFRHRGTFRRRIGKRWVVKPPMDLCTRCEWRLFSSCVRGCHPRFYWSDDQTSAGAWPLLAKSLKHTNLILVIGIWLAKRARFTSCILFFSFISPPTQNGDWMRIPQTAPQWGIHLADTRTRYRLRRTMYIKSCRAPPQQTVADSALAGALLLLLFHGLQKPDTAKEVHVAASAIEADWPGGQGCRQSTAHWACDQMLHCFSALCRSGATSNPDKLWGCTAGTNESVTARGQLEVSSQVPSPLETSWFFFSLSNVRLTARSSTTNVSTSILVLISLDLHAVDDNRHLFSPASAK